MGITVSEEQVTDWIYGLDVLPPAIEPDELTVAMAAAKLNVPHRRANEIMSAALINGEVTARKVRLPNGRKITAYRKKGESE